MKKLIALCAIVLTALLLITSVAGCQQKTQSPSSATGDIQITATINGLEKGEEATLTVSQEGSAASEELFFKRDVRSDGKKAITVDIAANLEDGYYQPGFMLAPNANFLRWGVFKTVAPVWCLSGNRASGIPPF